MVSIPVPDGQKDYKIHQNNQFLLFVDVSVFIRDLHQKKKLVLVLLQNVMTLVLVPASSADETETSTESKNWLFWWIFNLKRLPTKWICFQMVKKFDILGSSTTTWMMKFTRYLLLQVVHFNFIQIGAWAAPEQTKNKSIVPCRTMHTGRILSRAYAAIREWT